MFIKIIFFIFLLYASFEQNRPQIKILSVEDAKCSDTLGKMEYKAKFTCSPYQEIDSYFMLYYKDSSNKKRPTICKLSMLKKSDESGPGGNDTSISTNEIPTTIPDLHPEPTPSDEEIGETTNQVIVSDTASEESDQKTDEGSDKGTNEEKEEESDNPEDRNSDQADETTDDKSEEPTESPTELPTESPTDLPINGTDDDNLELYLSLLRGKIEDSLGNASITEENLYNLSLDLKVIYDYKVKNQFKVLLDRINKMEIKLNEFNTKNVYAPLDKSINILLQKIKEFDYKKIYDRINGTVCSVKQHFLNRINRRKSILGFGQNVLKNQIDTLKDKVEDKLNSSLLNDLISKYTNNNLNLTKIEESELGQKILNFAEKIRDLRKNGSSELLQKIDGFQNNLYELTVDHINRVMTNTANFVINHLLIIQSQMNEIKDLRDEYKDTNATANEIIKKTKQSMVKNFKKIKNNLYDFLENNPLLRLIVTQIKDTEEKINKALNESEVIQAIEAFIGDKKAQIEDFINNSNNETKSQLQESIYRIREILKKAGNDSIEERISNLPKLTSDLLKEFKNILEIDSIIDKLKEKINGTNLDDFNIKDNPEVKELIDNLKKKSEEFLNNTFLLKLIVDNAKKLNSDLKKELEKAGISNAFTKYIDTLKDIPKAFDDLNLENKEKLNQTFYDVIDKIKALNSTGLDKLPKFTKEDLEEQLSKIKNLPDDIKVKINETIDKAEELINKTKEFNKKLGEDFNSKIDEAGVKDALSSFISGAKNLSEIINENKADNKEYLKNVFYTIGDNINATLEKGKKIVEELKNIKSKEDIINKVNELTNLNLINDELKNIFDLPKRKENMEKLLKDLKENVENLNKEELKKIQDKLDEYGLKEPLNEYINGIKDLLAVIKKNGEINMELLKEKYNNTDKLNEMLEKAKELEQKLKDAKLEDIKDNLKNLTNIEPITEEIKDLFNGTKYSELNKMAAKDILEYLKTKLKDLETKYDNSEFKKQIEPLIEKTKESLDNANLTQSFYDFSENLQKLKAALEPLKDKLKDNIDIEKIIDTLKKLLLSFGNQPNFYDIYNNMKDDLLDAYLGFLSRIDKTGYMKNLTDSIDKNKLGNFSILDNLQELLLQLNNTPFKTQFPQIYEALNNIKLLQNIVKENLKIANLSSLQQVLKPLNKTIMELNGTEVKQKVNDAISKMEGFKSEISKLNQKGLENLPKYLGELEKLKNKLINLNETDLNWEEKINSIIEKIKNLEPGTLQQELLAKLSNSTNKLKENLMGLVFVQNLKNITNLVKDSPLFELMKSEQQKIMAELKKISPTDFKKLIEKLKEDIKGNEVLIELKDHLTDLKNLLEALGNLDENEKLNETVYKIVDKIKNFDFKEKLKEIAPNNTELYENLKGLTDIDESLEKIQELIKDSKLGELTSSQQKKLMKYLNELKAKIESSNIIDDLKNQTGKNEILNGIKSHLKDIKNLFDSLVKLNKIEKKDLNETFYELLEKIDKLDNQTILDFIAKLPNGEKIIEPLKELKSKLEKIKELPNKKLTMEDIKAKLDEIKDKIEKTEIPSSLKAHLEAIKEAILSYKNMTLENQKKIKETLYNIKMKIENINGTEMILLLNSSIFNFKDDFIEKIGNLTELENIKNQFLDNLNSLNPFLKLQESMTNRIDELKEKIEKEYTGPMKDKILEMVNNAKKQLDEIPKKIKDQIKNSELFKKYERLTTLIEELEINIKNFTKIENSTELNDIIEKLKENLSTKNIKIIIDKINENIFSCDTKLNTLMSVKKDIDEMKNKYENSNVKKIMDESKDEIKMFIQGLKENVNKLLDDPKYEPFTSDLKELNATLQESWKNIQEDEYVKQIKIRIDKTKEVLNKLKAQTELATLNETLYNMNAKVKNFIFNESINKINETKNQYMEEIQKYKDIQKQSERIKFLFESTKENNEKRLENAKKISQQISEKIKDLNVTILNEIVVRLNEMNERIVGQINGTEVEEQVNIFVKKIEEYEDIADKFPTTDEQSKYEKAIEDAKLKLLNHTPAEIVERLERMIGSNIETLNLTTIIIRLIVNRYKNKPDDVTTQELSQNISELIFKEFDKLEVPEFELINKDILADIKSNLDQKLSESDFSELNKKIQEAIENLKNELGSFKEMYKDKTLLEITDAIKKELKDINSTDLLGNQLNKLKNINNKIKNILKKMNLDKLKEATKQINIINEQSKNQINVFFTRIEKLNEKLVSLPKSKTLNRTLTAIKKLITKLNFSKTIEILKSLNASEINPKQEIENIKRIKNLTDEIKEIMDSSPLINIFGQILFQNLNKKTSEKRNRILQSVDTFGEMTCKMDDVPTSDSLTFEPEIINSYVLNNEVYDISTDSQLKIDFPNDELARCSSNKIPETYNNIICKSYSDVEVDHQKNRIKYKLNARILPGYTPPEFFYLNIKSKINHNNGAGNKQLDTDSYCVVEDSRDINNVIFNCYSYLDPVEDGTYEFTEMTSNYIQISNNSTQTPSRNYGNSYFRTSKSSLSAGAIVGIVLGCVAALAIIIGVIFCLRNSAKATVYPTQSINMSANNAIIPSESRLPVDYTQKNINV